MAFFFLLLLFSSLLQKSLFSLDVIRTIDGGLDRVVFIYAARRLVPKLHAELLTSPFAFIIVRPRSTAHYHSQSNEMERRHLALCERGNKWKRNEGRRKKNKEKEK